MYAVLEKSTILSSSLIDVLLSYAFAGHEIQKLEAGVSIHPNSTDHLGAFPMTMFMLQVSCGRPCSLSVCVCVCVCVRARACVRACVCVYSIIDNKS